MRNRMPSPYSYPGVYIEEIPSGVRTIVGVSTSITAFLGRAAMGPTNQPVRVQSFGAFERLFGGLSVEMPLTYAVQQYFQIGGAAAAKIKLPTGGTEWELEARNVGIWGDALRVSVDHDTANPNDDKQFNLTIAIVDPSVTPPQVLASETFRNLSTDRAKPRFAVRVLNDESAYVKANAPPSQRPDETTDVAGQGGTEGTPLNEPTFEGNKETKTGIYALDDADFNLLVIPPLMRYDSASATPVGAADPVNISNKVWKLASDYCVARRALLLVDSPRQWTSPGDAVKGITGLGTPPPVPAPAPSTNAAIFWPFLRARDALRGNLLAQFAPSGAVAGVIARTDQQVGVWKAAAGQAATVAAIAGLSYRATDSEIGLLNPLGLNCLRPLPIVGPVVWGARTTVGADRLANEWKYVPVRRTALFIEESLFGGLQWVVFEPNDEPLWAQIRLNVGAFMHGLFLAGAFQGSMPNQAYFVRCDAETNPQINIDKGIVTVVVGFAPLKPAEFVVVQVQQMAGQAAA
jgi:phage tail sheath protein FI